MESDDNDEETHMRIRKVRFPQIGGYNFRRHGLSHAALQAPEGEIED